MREIKKRNPERYCVLEYDKLFVDHKVFVWNEVVGQVSCEIMPHVTSVTAVSQVVEMNDSEKSLDPVTRAASALGRGRPGLTKAWSVSSPNMTNMDMDILERIRDLEGQIAAQQVSLDILQMKSLDTFPPGHHSLSAAPDLRVWFSQGYWIRESELRHLILRRGLGQHGESLSQHQHQWRHGWKLRHDWIINMYLVVYLIGFKIHVTITDDALQLLLTRATKHVSRCPVYTRV